MTKMRTRIGSIILAVAMLLTLLPMTVFAAETETPNNEMGISYSFEQALREALGTNAPAADEKLTIEDCQKLTGVLDLSNQGITEIGGYDYTAKGKTYGWDDLSEDEQAVLTENNSGQGTTWWAISSIGRALLNVTELNLSGNNIEYIPTIFLLGNPSIEKVILPEGLKAIGVSGKNADGTWGWGYNAFAHMKSLKEINIPDTVEYLADYSFAESINLEYNIEDLPTSLKSSGVKVFDMHESIRKTHEIDYDEVKVTGNIVAYLEKNPDVSFGSFFFEATKAYADAVELMKLDPNGMFNGAYGVADITGKLVIPANTTVSNYAFDGWEITSAVIPSSTTLGNDASCFANNNNLKDVTVIWDGGTAFDSSRLPDDVDVSYEMGTPGEDAAANGQALVNLINAAKDGDVINVPAGTYKLPSSTYSSSVNGTLTYGLKIDKDITLKGAGAGQTIITGDVSGYNSSMILFTKYDVDATIDGFTFEGGSWDIIGCDDPGVKNVTITNCAFNTNGNNTTPIKLKLLEGEISNNTFTGTDCGYGVRIISLDKRDSSWGGAGNVPDDLTVDIAITGNDFSALSVKDATRGVIHISTGDPGTVTISENSLNVIGGFAVKNDNSTAAIEAPSNYWGEGATVSDIANKIDGNISLDSYYTDAEMTNEVTLGISGILVSNAAELQTAVQNANEGDTILVLPGEYNLDPSNTTAVQGQTGWYLPITTDGITIQGVDAHGTPITDAAKTQATIYSTVQAENSNWATQNLITVFGNDATIAGVKIMPKAEVNKTIEVIGEDFTIKDCAIVPNAYVDDAPTDAGILYFNGNKGTVTVTGNYFNHINLSFDSVAEADSIMIENNTFDTPVDENTQLISNVTWTTPATLKMANVLIVNNTFKNMPEGYDRLILNRMGGENGAFVLQDNQLVKADGSADSRDIADMISFDDRFFNSWEEFVASDPFVMISKDGSLTILTPPAEEGDPVVIRTVEVTPAEAHVYTNNSITITAKLSGFEDDAVIYWDVDSDDNTQLTSYGNYATFRASKAGTYLVAATVDGISACAVITVTDQPSDGGSGGGSSTSGYLVSVDSGKNGKVTVSPQRAEKGETVTITVKPDEGYELDELTVTDKNGDSVKVTYKDDNKYTFKMPGSAVTVEATFQAVKEESPVDAFLDINTGAWYYDAVKYAVENGLMSGTGTYTFEPNTTLSRGMIAQMLYALEGKPSVSATNSFTDVSVNDWYAKAASWTQSKGIITGYNDGRFAPNDPLTREQLALILYNYAQSKGYDTSAKADLSKYVDGSSTSAWAQTAMTWAVGEGLLSGRGLNMLYPTGTATRAEVAQIMMNFCENTAK